jgi:hypothetical protein
MVGHRERGGTRVGNAGTGRAVTGVVRTVLAAGLCELSAGAAGGGGLGVVKLRSLAATRPLSARASVTTIR